MKWALQKVPLRGLQGGKYASLEASSMSLAINSSGLANTKTLLLMTPEEMDKVTKVTVDYQPPKV